MVIISDSRSALAQFTSFQLTSTAGYTIDTHNDEVSDYQTDADIAYPTGNSKTTGATSFGVFQTSPSKIGSAFGSTVASAKVSLSSATFSLKGTAYRRDAPGSAYGNSQILGSFYGSPAEHTLFVHFQSIGTRNGSPFLGPGLTVWNHLDRETLQGWGDEVGITGDPFLETTNIGHDGKNSFFVKYLVRPNTNFSFRLSGGAGEHGPNDFENSSRATVSIALRDNRPGIESNPLLPDDLENVIKPPYVDGFGLFLPSEEFHESDFIYVDPSVVTESGTMTYRLAGNAISEINLASKDLADANSALVTVNGITTELFAGETLNFSEAFGVQGVDRFTISGLGSSSGLITGLGFTDASAKSWLLISVVPEPSASILLLFAVPVFLRRKR